MAYLVIFLIGGTGAFLAYQICKLGAEIRLGLHIKDDEDDNSDE